MADALDELQQLLGGQGAQPKPGGGIGALFDAISGSPAIQAMRAPNAGAIDLSAATGLPPAMESMMGAERAYDPTRSFAANALDPRGIEQAMNVAMSVGPGAIRAYHGSPYDFSQFDLSKIGTGEGAQAYGHGLYFAEHQPVARGYRDALSAPPEPMKMEYKGGNVWDPLSRQSLPDDIYNGSMELHARTSWTRPDAMTPAYFEKMKGDLQNTIGNYEKAHGEGRTLLGDTIENERRNLENARAALNALNDPNFEIIPAKPSPGHMYEVQIDAEPEQFLDWDKPLSQQSAHVQNALSDVMEREAAYKARYPHSPMADPFGSNIYSQILSLRGADPSAPGTAWLAREGAPAASQELLDRGIPDIRYLDQGSRGAGQGTSNYSVFDANLIQIMRKFGILPPLAAGAAGAGLLGAGSEPPT